MLMSMQHSFPFDPTHGFTPEQLRAVAPPSEPADFDAFWRATHEQAMRVPLGLTVKDCPSASPRHRLREIRYATLEGVQLGAWLVEPLDEPVRMAVVMGHGYGQIRVPEYPARSAAFLFTCAPGFSLSAQPGLPSTVEQHVVHGLERRETYMLRYCVAALWSAARVMQELVPVARDRLVYMGDSFGGGLGAMALPWEPSFQRGYLGVPTFGHQELRLSLECVGSGHAVQQYVAQHPEALEVLRYFDAAAAARRIRIPVLYVPAHFDPAVPPAGQFAVANAASANSAVFELSAGHFDHPGLVEEYEKLRQITESFFWPEAPPWPV
jgi:cephalosporin-C deacetylase